MSDISYEIIQEIKKWPVIWDKRQYDAEVKQLAWLEVAKALGESDVNIIKSKFKNIRDAYERKKKALAQGKSRKLYVYHNELQFLEEKPEPFMPTPTPTVDNAPATDRGRNAKVGAVKLITEVKQRTELWDPKNPHYMNPKFSREAWAEIAKVLGEDDVTEVKLRYKNLRDSFRKNLRIDRNKVTWPYFDLMMFLKDCARPPLAKKRPSYTPQQLALFKEDFPAQETSTDDESDSDDPFWQNFDKPPKEKKAKAPNEDATTDRVKCEIDPIDIVDVATGYVPVDDGVNNATDSAVNNNKNAISHTLNERIIMEVRGKPLLWNSNLSTYFDRRKRADAWLEIAQKFHIEDVEKVKLRFKHLRDQYRRCQKKNSHKYPYYDLLKFLDDDHDSADKTSQKRRREEKQSTNTTTSSNSDASEQEDTKNRFLCDGYDLDGEASSSQGEFENEIMWYLQPNKRRKEAKASGDDQADPLPFSPEQRQKARPKDDDDDDHLFCRLIAMKLKKLPHKQKEDVKMKIFRLFDEDVISVAKYSSGMPYSIE